MSIIEFRDLIYSHLNPKETLLNLGCGIGALVGDWFTSNSLHVDIWEPYLRQIKNEMSVVKLNVNDLSCFIDKSWDQVVAFDLIEHLYKDEAMHLLVSMERIARKRIMLYTPVGFLPQEDGKGWGENNPEYQKHRCGFDEKELQNLGFQTYVIQLTNEEPGLLAIKEL